MRGLLILLTVFFVSGFAQSIVGQQSFTLGFVKGGIDEAGDSIWLANTKKIDRIDSKAIAVFGFGGSGTININGRDVKLKLWKAHLPDESFKVGRGGYQIWKGESTTVRLDYTFTWLCPPDDEQCEVYYYKGILDIIHEGKQRKVDITGFGGS